MKILYIENIFVLNSLLDVEFLRLVASKDKGLYDFVFFLFAAWLRCVCEVGRKCAGGDTAFQFVYVNIYVLISNNATSEILMKYKQNVSVLHTHTHTGTHTHPAPHS